MLARQTSGDEVMAAVALLSRSMCPVQYEQMLYQVALRTGLSIQQVEQRIEALAGRRNVT